MKYLVTIIIPTFNRCNFIGETLDSILAQRYKYWECIVVDDDSVDHTLQILKKYREKDSRIKFYSRPKNRKKGANACRNYGLELSKGDYIQWFDSDDLMTSDFLDVKMQAIIANKLDYVISKTESFMDNNPNNIAHRNENYYHFDSFEITNYNYVVQNINWLTYDFLGKRELVNKIQFNENLHAFQERNYFCKLTCYSTKTMVLDKYLTKVRLHSNSIQGHLKANEELYYKHLELFFFETWKELKDIGPKKSVSYLFERTVDYTMHYKRSLKMVTVVSWEYSKQLKFRALFWYLGYHISFLLIGRGYIFRKKLLNLR